jgi:hypothetical protein
MQVSPAACYCDQQQLWQLWYAALLYTMLQRGIARTYALCITSQCKLLGIASLIHQSGVQRCPAIYAGSGTLLFFMHSCIKLRQQAAAEVHYVLCGHPVLWTGT